VSTLHFLGERLESLLNRQRRAERTLSVIFMRDRRTEQCHDAVTQELVDGTFVTVNGFQDDLEDAVHDPVHILGIELLGHRRKPRHV